MKKLIMAMILSLTLTMCLCACGGGTAPASSTDAPATPASDTASPSATDASQEAATTPAEPTAPAGDTTGGAEEVKVTLPEDNGMAGVYKWIEMGDYGLEAYLILWDDGIGSIDMVGTGTVRGVFYNDETMQVADEGTVPQKYTYADDQLIWSYTDEQGEHPSTFVRLTAEERAAYEALGVGSVAGTGEEANKGNASPWPDDNGGLAGVYKWVEMEKMGVTANLIIFSDGTGVFDMLGVVESVQYDDTTMQTSGEGALPQNYTYADGTLTWTTAGEDGADVSTFIKLTAEELAAYEARGIGSAE